MSKIGLEAMDICEIVSLVFNFYVRRARSLRLLWGDWAGFTKAWLPIIWHLRVVLVTLFIGSLAQYQYQLTEDPEFLSCALHL